MSSQSRCSGYTMIELAFATILLGVLGAGMMQAVGGLHTAFADHQVVAQLSVRAERALDQTTTMAQQAMTTDSELELLDPIGASFTTMKFRVVDSLTGGAVNYNDTMKVFLMGPDPTTSVTNGLIIGRGDSISALSSAAAGSDGWLGTNDDVTATVDGVRNLEFLLPTSMKPRVGSMFTITPDATSPRLFLITLRVNSVDGQGNFVLAQDLVLQRRVALRQ